MLSQNQWLPGWATPCVLWCGGTQNQGLIILFLRRESRCLRGRDYSGDTVCQGQIFVNVRRQDWRLSPRRDEVAKRFSVGEDMAAAQQLVRRSSR